MTLHREGYKILLGLFGVLLLINIWVIQLLGGFWIGFSLFASVVIMLLIGQFFRIPKRKRTFGDNLIVSPADGKVVIIEKTFEPEYFKDERIQISIFMSPFNVHQNLIPIDGVIEYYRYHPGKYLVAWHPKSSTLNERNTTVIRTDGNQKVLLRQIAGAVAKRIRYYLKEGDEVTQNQEMGFIKFGSRVDLFLPLDADILVKLGDKTLNGVSKIALLNTDND